MRRMGPGERGQGLPLTSRTQGAQLVQEGQTLVTRVTRVRTGTWERVGQSSTPSSTPQLARPRFAPPTVRPFGSSRLTERLKECRSGGRQSRARAGGGGRRAGPGHPGADALAGIVLHHLPRHLGQDALSECRGCGLRVGAEMWLKRERGNRLR